MPLSNTTINRLKKAIGPEYERDVKDLLSARHFWKKSRDNIEVISKILSGVASVVAFGASSVDNAAAKEWMAFGAGCIGTLSLTMMLFSSYSGRVSRQRTRELNNVLKLAGVSSVPQIASATDPGDDIEAPPMTSFDASLLNPIKSQEHMVS
jgi:hypothetical protein